MPIYKVFTSVRWNQFEFLQKRRIRCLWGHGLENSVSTWRTAWYNFKLSLITIVCICKLSASPCKLKQALHVILQKRQGWFQKDACKMSWSTRVWNPGPQMHRIGPFFAILFNLQKTCERIVNRHLQGFTEKLWKQYETDMMNFSVEINISLQMWRPPGPQI